MSYKLFLHVLHEQCHIFSHNHIVGLELNKYLYCISNSENKTYQNQYFRKSYSGDIVMEIGHTQKKSQLKKVNS